MSNSAIVLYPHQLFKPECSWLPNKDVPIYLVEEVLFLSEFPIHNQKLLLHRLSMKAYEKELQAAGFRVFYLEINSQSKSSDVFKLLTEQGITQVTIPDTTDNWLERRIEDSCRQFQLTREKPASKLFWLSKSEATERYLKSKKHLASFYKKLRLDKSILITQDKEPLYGSWSFDDQNRQRLPKNIPLPAEIFYTTKDNEIEAALKWLEQVPGTHYGHSAVWLPYTRSGALVYLNDFIENRLVNFGTYEDAISSHHTRLFHSTISPLLNIGLLEVKDILQAVTDPAIIKKIPINSLEGFIRQIIGWREFIRAAYEVDGTKMRTTNFFGHKNKIPDFFWNGETDITPLKHCLKSTLQYGYNHHIERLMVLGNFLLLTRTDPDDVYQWFMTMYIDAYDWVMVPNVYGMSQFADGGIFATKPYIGGGNYLKKMSDYENGAWEEIYTALYWEFIKDHSEVFEKNHRLSMMPKLYQKLPTEKKDKYTNLAKGFINKNEPTGS